ncbi:uncharacterized protein [Haliotis cracherodii]|uniref:uncharacterized protein n=1 Tax=Haliotis cracherodii TaxID=6455 RepID=UPI0039E7F9A8
MYVLVVLKPIETNGRQLHTVHQVPSSSQYLQQYTVNLAGKSQYFLTVIVHEDVVDLLSQAVGELHDPKVFTHDIESCPMKTFTKVHGASGLLHLNSTVPFGLIVHSMKDDVASSLEPGMLMDQTNCPTGVGFMYFPADDMCVKYEHRELTRQFASIHCHIPGGFLFDIKTDKMFQTIKGIYAKFGGPAFIGGFMYRYSETFKIWLWSDCDPITGWSAKNSRSCLALYGSNMEWDGRNCNRNSSSICGFDVQHVSTSGTIRRSRKRHGTRCKHLLPDIIERLGMTTGTSILTSKESTHHDTTTVETDHTGIPSTTGITPHSTANETEPTYDTSTIKEATSITPSDATTDTLKWTRETLTESTMTVKVTTDASTQQKTTKNVPSTPTSLETMKTTQIQPDESPKPVTLTVQYDRLHRNTGQQRTLNMTVLMQEFLKSPNNSLTVLKERENILSMIKKGSWRCNCFCRSNRLQNMSKEAVQEHRERVKKELGVDTSSLRKTRSKKTCAIDNRPSANAVGCFGFMFLIFPVALIILSDINTLLIKHNTHSRKKKQSGCYINLSRSSMSSSSSGS